MSQFAMITIHVDARGGVSALASEDCRYLSGEGEPLVVDVGGYRVSVEPLQSVAGRDRLLPLAFNPNLYGESHK